MHVQSFSQQEMIKERFLFVAATEKNGAQITFRLVAKSILLPKVVACLYAFVRDKFKSLPVAGWKASTAPAAIA